LTFADTQALINYGWKKRTEHLTEDFGKQKERYADQLEKARKNKCCIVCIQQGFKVKMDFIKNVREKHLYSMYDIEIWRCPRCGKIERFMKKDHGRGRCGVDSYKLTGFTS